MKRLKTHLLEIEICSQHGDDLVDDDDDDDDKSVDDVSDGDNDVDNNDKDDDDGTGNLLPYNRSPVRHLHH